MLDDCPSVLRRPVMPDHSTVHLLCDFHDDSSNCLFLCMLHRYNVMTNTQTQAILPRRMSLAGA